MVTGGHGQITGGYEWQWSGNGLLRVVMGGYGWLWVVMGSY